jgi:hypothetical protein
MKQKYKSPGQKKLHKELTNLERKKTDGRRWNECTKMYRRKQTQNRDRKINGRKTMKVKNKEWRKKNK